MNRLHVRLINGFNKKTETKFQFWSLTLQQFQYTDKDYLSPQFKASNHVKQKMYHNHVGPFLIYSKLNIHRLI